MRILVALAILPIVLAGCADPPSGDGAGTEGPHSRDGHAQHDPGSHLLAPNWTVGDSWTFQLGDRQVVLAVSGDQGSDWVMDTNDDALAFANARFDLSLLGPVRKTDLAGSQGADRIEFLKFPLTADLKWTTTWDGEPVAITVLQVADFAADVEARRQDGSLYAAYTYDARERYFSSFVFYAEDGTTERFVWTLHHSAPGYAGDLLRYALTPLFEHHGPFPGTMFEGFSVEPGLTDVFIGLDLVCTAGALSLHVGEAQGIPEERGFSATGPCPLELHEQAAIAAASEAEQWGVLASPVPAATAADLDLVVMGRVLQAFKAGNAAA